MQRRCKEKREILVRSHSLRGRQNPYPSFLDVVVQIPNPSPLADRPSFDSFPTTILNLEERRSPPRSSRRNRSLREASESPPLPISSCIPFSFSDVSIRLPPARAPVPSSYRAVLACVTNHLAAARAGSATRRIVIVAFCSRNRWGPVVADYLALRRFERLGHPLGGWIGAWKSSKKGSFFLFACAMCRVFDSLCVWSN